MGGDTKVQPPEYQTAISRSSFTLNSGRSSFTFNSSVIQHLNLNQQVTVGCLTSCDTIAAVAAPALQPVSYTHLTLPTKRIV